MQDEDVKQYLKDHPAFFEQQASFLADIHLPSPHGSGTISLAERQQLAQRDKVRVLEAKLANLIDFAKENDVTSDKIHAFSLKLMRLQQVEPNFYALQNLIVESMQQDFAVAQARLHIWLAPTNSALNECAVFKPVIEAFSDWCKALNAPFCGEKPAVAVGLFDAKLLSHAFIPLCNTANSALNTQDKKHAFGVLVLSSKDSQRFKKEMGTMYLARAGDLISTALAAYL